MKNNQKKSISSLAGNVLFWIILASFIALFVASNHFLTSNLKEVPISNVISRANKGEIKSLDIQGNDVKVTLKDKNQPTEKSIKESGTIYEQGLEKGKVEVKVAEPDKSSDVWWNLAIMLVPTVAIIGFFVFMMRQAGGQN